MSDISKLELPSWVSNRRDSHGPWFGSIKLAISDDGLNFVKTNRVLAERGGVSNLCIDSKGRIIASYQNFSFLQEKDFDKIAISISSDDGETWEGPITIRFNGLNKIGYNPMDPAMVLLSDGRLRLYSTSGRLPDTDFRGGVGCVSAISSNDVDFKAEEGFRFKVEKSPILDPTVIKINNKWHYYSPIQNEQDKNYHGISDDGLYFERVDDIVLDMRMLGCACAVEGGYRFYGTGPRGMSAFSTDGYNWIQENVKMPGADPGVVRLKKGKYLMSYTVRRVI